MKLTNIKKTNFFTQRDPNAPKRPLSSFFLYSADNRYEVRRQLGYVGYTPFSAGTVIAKELGRMWRNEDAETKAYYKEISLRNFAKYKTDMEAYNNREFAWHILVKN